MIGRKLVNLSNIFDQSTFGQMNISGPFKFNWSKTTCRKCTGQETIGRKCKAEYIRFAYIQHLFQNQVRLDQDSSVRNTSVDSGQDVSFNMKKMRFYLQYTFQIFFVLIFDQSFLVLIFLTGLDSTNNPCQVWQINIIYSRPHLIGSLLDREKLIPITN